MKSFVLAITGPTGAGKTTISEMLSKELDSCVNIDADHIKHMIVSGFEEAVDKRGDKTWKFTEWELVGESIGLLAKNFADKRYSIIINGYIEQEAWEEIQKHVEITHKIMLLPEIFQNYIRDSKRSEEIRMGQAAVEDHHYEFTMNNYYADFTKLNTTDDTVEETVKRIEELLT